MGSKKDNLVLKNRSTTSRYNATPMAALDDNGFRMENSFVIYPDSTDKKIVIKRSEEGRPDLISYRVYGNPLYGWVIMQRNGVLDPFSLTPGKVLFVPSFDRLVNSGFVLNP